MCGELREAVHAAFAQARQSEQPEIAAAGAQNLLDQPEFHDLRKLRSILRIVEEQKTLYHLIADEWPPMAGPMPPQRQDRPRARHRRALRLRS